MTDGVYRMREARKQYKATWNPKPSFRQWARQSFRTGIVTGKLKVIVVVSS